MDRNSLWVIAMDFFVKSLSVRRAWIEILDGRAYRCIPNVALRKESVDRNVNLRVLDGSKSSSLSVRRAWIEISKYAL